MLLILFEKTINRGICNVNLEKRKYLNDFRVLNILKSYIFYDIL